MNKMIKICALFLALSLGGTWASPAFANDVFLVYKGADRKIQQEIERQLPENIGVKPYNAGLLLLADYTGQQKAIARLRRAKAVVVINDAAPGIIASGELSNVVQVSDSSAENIHKIMNKLNNWQSQLHYNDNNNAY